MVCDCHIIKRNGEPLTTADYDKDSQHAPSRVLQCPLHENAAQVLAALKEIVGIEWAQDPESSNVRDEHLKQYERLIKKSERK